MFNGIFKNIIVIVSNIFQLYIFLTGLIYLFLSVKGLRKSPSLRKKPHGQALDRTKAVKLNRFAVIVPAYNEENVLGFTLESLKRMDYPKELFDIYLVADHCTDKTAEIARNCAIPVYEHTNPLPAGKGYALRWGTEKILFEKQYDAVCYFDADSLAHPGFLKAMNRHLNAGEKAVQGRQVSKNPREGWIPRMLCVGHITANRFYQGPKYEVGLSATLHGKGMCFAADIARGFPWDGSCLTEDLEIQMRLVSNNVKITWAGDAVVYDEEPVTVRQYLKRAVRWTAGALDVARRHMPALFRKGIIGLDMSAFESGLWCSHVYRMFFVCATGALIYYSKDSFNFLVWLYSCIPGAGLAGKLFFIMPLAFYPALALFFERAKWDLFAAYFFQPSLGLFRIPVFIAGIFRSQADWCRTEHASQVAISDLVE